MGLSYLTGTLGARSVGICEQTPIVHSPETYVYSFRETRLIPPGTAARERGTQLETSESPGANRISP